LLGEELKLDKTNAAFKDSQLIELQTKVGCSDKVQNERKKRETKNWRTINELLIL
jgi:hypothetical protein